MFLLHISLNLENMEKPTHHMAYSEGLKHHPVNPVLYCNRQWEQMSSIDDCKDSTQLYKFSSKMCNFLLQGNNSHIFASFMHFFIDQKKLMFLYSS